MSTDFECPYCEAEIDEPDDCNSSGANYEHECRECGKNFIFRVEYEKTYTTFQADCLNGGEHKYESMCGAPIKYFEGRFRCANCHHEIKKDEK